MYSNSNGSDSNPIASVGLESVVVADIFSSNCFFFWLSSMLLFNVVTSSLVASCNPLENERIELMP